MKYINHFEDFKKISYGLGKYQIPNKAFEYEKVMVPMSDDETVDYIIKNCSEFVERPTLIYRSANSKVNFFRSEPIERISRDNPNWYTLAIDNSKYWKDYPKRGKSFICSMSDGEDEPNFFQYIVIPENGSKWGIAPEEDIYYCFQSTIGSPDEFFNMMNQMSLNLKLGGISDDSFEEMKEDINKLQKNLHERWKNFLDFEDYYGNYLGYNTKDLFGNFLWKFWEKDILEQIQILMDPKKNYFELSNYKKIEYTPFYSELWTDSPCVFVKYNNHLNIMSKIRQKVGKELNFER